MICELCHRDVERLTVHHLIPRQKTKRQKLEPGETINICYPCHKQIHTLFDNSHLAKELNSLDKLQNDAQIQKFLAWIRKQNSSKQVRVHRQRKD